jgi:MFS family permease
LLLLINIIINIGQQMLTPNMARYMSMLGSATHMLGMASSVFSMAALLIRPVSGVVADRLDEKKMLIASFIGITMVSVCYCFAQNVIFFLSLRFLHGIFYGMCTTLAMAIASQSLPEEKMTFGIGIYGLTQIVAMSVAPTLGLYLISDFNYLVLFIAASGTFSAGVLVSFLLHPVDRAQSQAAQPPRSFLKSFSVGTMIAREALPPALIITANNISYGLINAFVILYGQQMQIRQMGLFFTVYAAAVLVFRPMTGKMMERFTIGHIVISGGVLLMIGFITVSMADSLFSMLCASVLFGVGNGVTLPALQACALQSVPASRRGVASGTIYMGMDLGLVLGPAIGGVIAGMFGYRLMFFSGVVPVLAGFVIYRRCRLNKGPNAIDKR